MSRSLFVYSGLIGPIIYAIVLFSLGILEPGYDPISQSMSELGAVDAQNALIMNSLGFPLLGLFFILFSIGVYQNFSLDRTARIGPLMIASSGVFLLLTGVFQCDSGCIDVTLNGTLHSFFATLAAIVMIPVPLTIIPHIYSDESWRYYIWFSWIIVILAGIVSLLYMFPELESLNGLLQRLAMAGPLVWIEVTAFKIYQRSKQY